MGAYPNDPETSEAVNRAVGANPHVSLVINPLPGPTTKADCLNTLWSAMIADEISSGRRYKAVVLHDSEDVVHPDELALFDFMMDRFTLVQLPVLPLPSQQSRWIAGHYCDEFAEAHGKSLVVREAVGAAVPSAGVGCAFERGALDALAVAQGGLPFDPGSLTEDYEIGLRLTERGGKGAFVLMRDREGQPVCTREHFPETLAAAVRQKARWTVGIALSGWDRLGWDGSLTERWMRLRDRRAGIAALVLVASYMALLLYGILILAELAAAPPPLPMPTYLPSLMIATGVLMAWRLLIRMLFVWGAYGWRQAVLSIPRTLIANLVAMLAARRAVWLYIRTIRGGPLVWEKTQHRFPDGEVETAA